MMRIVHLEGPLSICRRVLEEIIADIDNGLRVEDEGFAQLISGSSVSLDDIRRNSYGVFRQLRRWSSGSPWVWFKPGWRNAQKEDKPSALRESEEGGEIIAGRHGRCGVLELRGSLPNRAL
jgi:hypothetical protein